MNSLSPFRRELQRLVNQAVPNSADIDRHLRMSEHTLSGDLEASLRATPAVGLLRLQTAMREQFVIRKAYRRLHREQTHGCIFHFALGFNSNEDLWAWGVSDEIMSAVSRSMRRFDYGQLNYPELSIALEAELVRRGTSAVSATPLKHAAADESDPQLEITSQKKTESDLSTIVL